eukprot:GHVT01093959.1.p1 GENE.GHVT01093959.1~~GHVT01093959.1.p1  ORF type:complete len:267 (-),score=30.64 GHVT01093959.1:807-1607(-)
MKPQSQNSTVGSLTLLLALYCHCVRAPLRRCGCGPPRLAVLLRLHADVVTQHSLMDQFSLLWHALRQQMDDEMPKEMPIIPGIHAIEPQRTYEAHPSGQADPETKSMHEHKNLQHKECRTPARMEKSKRTEGFATSHELLQDGPVPRPTSWDAMGYPPQIRLVPQSMLNAYHPLICRHTDSHQCYAPGDFVVAFPRLVDLSDAVAEALISAALHTAITSIPTDLAAPYMQEWNTQQATTRYTQVTNGHCSYTRDKIGDDQPMQSGN